MENLAKVLDTNLNESIADMGTGNQELLLHCVQGIYEGYFLYLNTTAEGEKFGSGDQEAYNLTICVENAGLSPQHTLIKYESGTYRIFDLNSETGTWLNTQRQQELWQTIDDGMQIMIGEKKFNIEKMGPIDMLNSWGHKFDIQYIQDSLRDCTTLEDLQKVEIDSLNASTEQKTRFKAARSEMVVASLSNQSPMKFKITGENYCPFEVSWLDYTVGDSPDCDFTIPDLPVGTRVRFTVRGLDTYMINEGVGEAYVQLPPDQGFEIFPDMSFKIGSLIFQVRRYNVGLYWDKGTRPEMEDSDIIVQNYFVPDFAPMSYFAIYDGHGGYQWSAYLKQNLHTVIHEKIKEHIRQETNVREALKNAICEGFSQVDTQYKEQNQECADDVGSTACVVMIIGDRILVSNLGDSRAVLCRNGQAIDLSRDHKPGNAEEQDRITAQGGFVSFNRLMGSLAVSRSFGDFMYKDANSELPGLQDVTGPLVSIEPEIREIFLDPRADEFIILACDGLFDVFSNQDVVDLAREKLKQMETCEQDPQTVVRDIVNNAIYTQKSTDNVSAMLITLKCDI